jgi:hypothetical protein
MKVAEFLGEVFYDPSGQMLFAKQTKSGFRLIGNVQDLPEIVSVRGWGAIQKLFKDQKEAEAFQDAIGNFMADAINAKVKSDAITDQEKDFIWMEVLVMCKEVEKIGASAVIAKLKEWHNISRAK